MKILIVDDNSDTRKLIRSIMKPHGHDIVESHNGADAVRSYGTHRPDCVLMDIEMEGMDGITAAKAIRQEYSESRIIMVTMYDDARLRTAAQEAGAAGYVLKENLMELPALLVSK
jgi:CheY-like chemotaxis protein